MKKLFAIILSIFLFIPFAFSDESNFSVMSSNPIGVLPGGEEAHYLMNDNLGSTVVLDNTGNHNGVSVRNTSLISATGQINLALTFDGADDKIDCQSDFIGTNACTVTAWIKPTTFGEAAGAIVNNGKYQL